MTRAEVRTFIESGIQELSELVGFDSGRITEFNSERGNTYPFAWLESISNSPTFTEQNTIPFDSWSIVIHIAKKAAQDSTAKQYESMIDDADALAQQLQYHYNSTVSGFKLVTIESMSRVPFIKKHADVLAGVIFSFTLVGPDTTNLC